MYIVIQHEISDPTTFRDIAASAVIPSHLKLHQVLPNEDGSRSFCLWEADSVNELEQFMEPAVGHISRNAYHPVAIENAFGLPRPVEA